MTDHAQSASRTQDAPRDCDGCNVCCTAMRVSALDKPAGVGCEHQTDHGCGNYQHRPEVCRSWFCLWVRDDKAIFTDDHRPDRLGLFFTASQPDPQTGRQAIYAHEIAPGSATRPQAIAAVKYLRQFVPLSLIPFRNQLTELTVAGQAAA